MQIRGRGHSSWKGIKKPYKIKLDQETSPEIIPYGWLVEVDNYHDDCQITIPECSKWNITLRYHSPENLSNPQLQWLTNEFKAIHSAVYSADKTSTDWENYLDVESIARFGKYLCFYTITSFRKL